MKVLLCDDVRAADQNAQKLGIPAIVLMEHAAMALADAVFRAQKRCGGRVAILCGSGNNGGDGYALARLLWQKQDIQETVFCRQKPDALCEAAKVNAEAVEKLQIPILCFEQFQPHHFDIIVDCLFGTGLNRNLDQDTCELIYQINQSGGYIIACDIPSGLCADSGKVMGCAVKAQETITFAAGKLGLYMNAGIEHCGLVRIADIGIPPLLLQQYSGYTILDDLLIQSFLPIRKENSHKRSYGNLLLIGAKKGMYGALLMAAKAALRCGAGLVTMMGDEGLVHNVAAVSEAMCLPYPIQDAQYFQELLKQYDCVSIGNGLGRDESAMWLVQQVWLSDRPAVFDGDALYLLGQWKKRKDRSAPYVLTPHPKELSYLLGVSTAELIENPIEALKLSESAFLNGVIVMKNSRTLITDGKRRYLNLSGNHGLATGGSGDVLCGMIIGLMGQSASPLHSSACAVYLHGKCADTLREQMAARSILPSDIIEQLPKELQRFDKY